MALVTSRIHKEYSTGQAEWKKWRLAFKGGFEFKNAYLVKRPKEDATAFEERFAFSYVPAFAKEAIFEIARSIHQRISKVTRMGGTGTFLQCVNGANGGVDRTGKTMNSFLGTEVIDELLSMGKVGIFVDNVVYGGETKAAVKDTDHPYCYIYKREDIRDWAFSTTEPSKLLYVVLREYSNQLGPDGFPPDEPVERYRHLWIDPISGAVNCQFYNKDNEVIDPLTGEPNNAAPVPLQLTRIPFIIADLGLSLMEDVADYQIAMMILASCDMNYAVKSNIPFYVEQRDKLRDDIVASKIKGWPKDEAGNYINPEDLTDDQREKFVRETEEVIFGNSVGRTYAPGYERPGFIAPPSDPLRVSMEKQREMKTDIRELVGLAVKTLGMRFQSTESKQMDEQPLEAGISFIGLVLEAIENEIAAIWAEYESATPASIKYPINYQLLTDAERRAAAKECTKIASAVPSITFRRNMQKQIAVVMLGHILDAATLEQINSEVDACQAPTADPEELKMDVDMGLVSAEYASEKVRGYPAGEAAKAQQEKAARLALQAQAQTPLTADQKVDPDQYSTVRNASLDNDLNPQNKDGRGKGQKIKDDENA